jgi:hypothetical protein
MKHLVLTLLALCILNLIKQLKGQSSIDLLNINVKLTKLSDTKQIEFNINGPLSKLISIYINKNH